MLERLGNVHWEAKNRRRWFMCHIIQKTEPEGRI